MPKVADSYLEARKRSILEAATRVFSQKGVQSATMADVAREADISPGAIYRYFESKEALALGCFDDNARAVTSEWLHEPEASPEPLADFADLSRATMRLLEQPGHALTTVLDLEALIHAYRDDPQRLSEMRLETQAVCEGIQSRVEASQKAGQLTDDVDAAVLARALYAFYMGVRVTCVHDQDTPVIPQLDALITLMAKSASS